MLLHFSSFSDNGLMFLGPDVKITRINIIIPLEEKFTVQHNHIGHYISEYGICSLIRHHLYISPLIYIYMFTKVGLPSCSSVSELLDVKQSRLGGSQMSMKVWEISLTIQGNCTIPWHTYCTSTVKILPLLASCKHWKIQSLKCMYVSVCRFPCAKFIMNKIVRSKTK